jgi:uncharacterized protein
MRYVEKRNSFVQLAQRIRRLIRPANVQIKVATPNMRIIRDLHVPMRDGSYLSANLYLPTGPGPFPVLLCLHPARKDKLCKNGYVHIQFRFARQPGQISISDETSFEAPDPDFWVPNGYAFLNIDKRGFGISPPGDKPQMYWGDGEIQDIYDAIEWAGVQDWSNGNVGMLGVSYLAMNQYRTAALHPPHLKAICPWEGVSDLYREFFFYGGVPEEGFVKFLFGRLRTFGHGPDIESIRAAHTLRDDYWKSLAVPYEKITVPILNCINFGTHMLHARGSARIHGRTSSEHKWLYTHRTGEWTAFYSPDANALMLKFFDYFLKGIDNGMLQHPKVRLEVREFAQHVTEVRDEDQWPLGNISWTPLYLDTRRHRLTTDPVVGPSVASFDLAKGSTAFSYVFDRDTEIVGPMQLTVHVELERCDDAYLFAGLQKYHHGKEVSFEGTYGFENDIVSKGALRVALRSVNKDLSLPYWPEYDFDTPKPVGPGEIVQLVFQLEAAATYYRRGDELRLTIQGRNFISGRIIDQPFRFPHNKTGTCKIHTQLEGGPNQLLLPIIDKRSG